MSTLRRARNLRMGVAVPIKNMKYRLGTSFNTTLSADGPTWDGGSSTWVLFTYITSPAALTQIFLSKKDQVLLGPSTHPDNPGGREIVLVDSTTYPGTIHILDEPAFLYLEDDPVSGVGERLAGSWDPSSDDVNVVSPVGIRDEAYGSELVDAGVYDQYRNRVRIEPGQYLEQNLGNILLSDTQYLFGCFYKMTGFDSNGPGLAVSVYDLSGLGTPDQFISQYVRRRTEGTVTDWTFFLSSTLEDQAVFTRDGTNGVTSGTPEVCVVRFPAAGGGSGNNRTWVESDMPFLCHAQRTSGYRAGIFTFDHLPVLGSVQWSWINNVKQIRLANGELREYDPTGGGGRVRKHTFRCQFENTSSDFFDNVNTLQHWQEEGNDLVLVTGEQYYGGSLPPVLVGRMTTKQVNKKSWALGLRSFSFTFTET